MSLAMKELEQEFLSDKRLLELHQNQDPIQNHGIWEHVQKRLTNKKHPVDQDTLEALLPKNTNDVSWESQLLLARICSQASNLATLPRVDLDTLPMRLQVEWTRVYLSRDPEHGTKIPLIQIIRDFDWSLCPNPCALLTRLMKSDDSALQVLALKTTGTLLTNGRLTVAQAQNFGDSALQSNSDSVVIVGLQLLQRPCFHVGANPPDLPKCLLQRHTPIAEELLENLSLQSDWETLAEVFRDHPNLVLRRKALQCLGLCLPEERIYEIIHRCYQEARFLAPEAILLVRDSRRRGHTFGAKLVDLLYQLTLETPRVSSKALSETLEGRWSIWLANLERLPDSDVGWPYQLNLLVQANCIQTRGFLLRLIREDLIPAFRGELISALGRAGISGAEKLVLEHFEAHPEACHKTLLSIGGKTTQDWAMERLSGEQTSSIASSLLVDLLLSIGETPEEFFELIEPTLWSQKNLLKLCPSIDRQALQVLQLATKSENLPTRLIAIKKIGLLGTMRQLEVLKSLLTIECVESRAAVISSIHTLGSRLFRSGKPCPSLLRLASHPQEAGNRALEICFIELLNHHSEENFCKYLMEQLAGLPNLGDLTALTKWKNHKDPDLRKWVVKCYGNSQEQKHGSWLVSLLNEDCEKTVRWALEALASISSPWASEAVARTLDHPNMNIKKTAARALQTVGCVRAVPKLLYWLSHHDNPEFREEMIRALQVILVDDYIPVLAVWKTEETEQRALQNLDTALNSLSNVRPDFPYSGPPDLTNWLSDSGSVDKLEETLIELVSHPGRRRALEKLRNDTSEIISMLLTHLHTHQNFRLLVCLELLGLLSPAERLNQIPPLRALLEKERADFEEVFHLLKACDAVLTPDELNLAWSSDSSKLRIWALESKLSAANLHYTGFLDALFDIELASCHRRVLSYGVDQGWSQALIKDSRGLPASTLRMLRELCQDHHCTPDSKALTNAWSKAAHNSKPILLEWIFSLTDPIVEDFALRLLERSSSSGQAAVAFLKKHPTHRVALHLRKAVNEASLYMRQQAAKILLFWGDQESRDVVLKNLFDNRLEASTLGLRLRANELDMLLKSTAGETMNPQILWLLTHSLAPIDSKIEALLALRGRPVVAETWQVKAAFAVLPEGKLLKALESEFRQDDFSSLELVSRCTPVPPRVLQGLRSACSETALVWLRLLARWGALLRGDGLAEVLLQLAKTGPEPDLALDIYVQLADWKEADTASSFIDTLRPLLAVPSRKDSVWSKMLKGLRYLPQPQRLVYLLELRKGAHQEEVFSRLTDLYLQAPSILVGLPEDVRAVLGRRILKKALGQGESAGLALKQILLDWEEMAQQALEEALEHPESRVRAYAHRMLKKRLPREEFLELTCDWLKDPIPEFRKRAIRILSFARYQPAIKGIVALLTDRKRQVDRTAREGLLYLGHSALSALRHAEGRARPDRRSVYTDLIIEIKNLQSGGEQPSG